MSLSNPHEKGQPNPSTRWFEWNGELGIIRYYDKESKQTIIIEQPFTFIVLDELGGIGGWHDASQSGIYSNEVKDTRQDVFIVKAFKGGTLAEGIYRDIKDRVHSVGGLFNAVCYIAFKDKDEELKIGAFRFKGASLAAWMEFRKQHRNEFYNKAIKISGFNEGKKGRIVYRTPLFATVDIASETIKSAVELDMYLQTYLKGYLSRNKKEQTDITSTSKTDIPEDEMQHIEPAEVPMEDTDIPF